MTDAFFHHNGERYDLIAFVVIPNHVHAVLRPMEVQQAGEEKPQFVPISSHTPRATLSDAGW